MELNSSVLHRVAHRKIMFSFGAMSNLMLTEHLYDRRREAYRLPHKELARDIGDYFKYEVRGDIKHYVMAKLKIPNFPC